MPLELCFGRATDGQERYISVNSKSVVSCGPYKPTPHQKPPQNSLFFVSLQSETVPSLSDTLVRGGSRKFRKRAPASNENFTFQEMENTALWAYSGDAKRGKVNVSEDKIKEHFIKRFSRRL